LHVSTELGIFTVFVRFWTVRSWL